MALPPNMTDLAQPSSAVRTTKRDRPDDSSTMLATLPCRRCRSRKVKCDGAFPTCNGCLKADIPCIIADASATRDYTRAEVQGLEEKIRELEAQVRDDLPPATPNYDDSNTSQVGAILSRDHRNAVDVNTHYVGEESGTNFMRRMMNSIRQHGSKASHRFISTSRVSEPSPAYYCPPHGLPARNDTVLVVKEYLRKFHIIHPLLDQGKIWSMLEHVYERIEDTDHTSSPSRGYRHDLFQLNMILAIGSVEIYRQGRWAQEPFGYFTAALKAIAPLGFSFGSIEDVTNFLLIARFGLLYYIGCSAWEICQICLRICIELKLHHSNHKIRAESGVDEQRRRRVFWDCYQLDRYSSAMLGRPFGIDEEDIDVEYPFDADDVSSGDLPQANTTNQNTDMTISIHLLQLSRITSRIHHSIYSKQNPGRLDESRNPVRISLSTDVSQMGEIFSLLKGFHDELAFWRATAPHFGEPKCVYQTQDWFELSYQRERLALLRAAVKWVPTHSHFPPKEILSSCVGAACAVIRIYNDMRKKALVTYTRGFTLMIFSSAIVVMFAVSRQMHTLRRQEDEQELGMAGVGFSSWWSSLFDDSVQEVSIKECLQVLKEADDVLSWMAEGMSDMESYATFFATLLEELESTAASTDNYPGSNDRSTSQCTHNQSESNVEHSDAALATYTRIGQQDDYSSVAPASTTENVSSAQAGVAFPCIDSTLDVLFDSAFSDDQFHPLQLSSWPFTQSPLAEGMTFGLDEYQWDLGYSI